METKECHLIVFVHGLWGITAHFDSIISGLLQSNPTATELFDVQYYHKKKYFKRSDLDLDGESVSNDEITSPFLEFKYRPKSTGEEPLSNKRVLPPSGDNTELIIYRTNSNEEYFTYDGIDVCGTRVAEEIDNVIDHLQNASTLLPRRVTKISIVGYSLGGLICRYAIGLLYSKGLFETIQPILFTTFCSPHVGVVALGSGISARMYNWLVPRVLSTTGRQLFLSDHGLAPYGSVPLLVAMAQENSSFYKGLSMFRKRVIYGNIVNDIRTSWYTALIELYDPWEYYGMNKLSPVYVNGYSSVVINCNVDPVVLDTAEHKETVQEAPESEVKPRAHTVNRNYDDINSKPEELSPTFWARKFKWLLVLYKLVFMVPYFALTVMCSGIYHGWLSYHRQIVFKKNHSWLGDGEDELLQKLLGIPVDEDFDLDTDDIFKNDKADTGLDTSDTSAVSEENINSNNWSNFANDAADDVMNSVLDAISYGELPVDRDLSNQPVVEGTGYCTNEVQNEKSTPKTIFAKQHDKYSAFKRFQLDMYNSTQVFIIESLNKLSWAKYGVHITRTKMAHAAAIVRHEVHGGLFDEGFQVIRHWVNEEVEV